MNRGGGHVLAVALALALWALAPAAARAAQDGGGSVGLVKTARGEAWVETDGRTEIAAPGTRIHATSVIRTGGGDSAVGIALKDNTLISLGPGAELRVDEFRFAPASGALALVLRLGRGSLEFVSGAIARLRPEAVIVNTPTASLGVRGTRFLVRTDE